MLLVSEPFMMDPNFRRTVVLLAEHDEKGTVGFVLNKVLDLQPKDAISDFPDYDHSLILGGPVQKDNLFFIHKYGKKIPGTLEITKGLYWGGDYDVVKELVKSGDLHPGNIRFFVGYSGWEGGQLEKELETNSWIVSPVMLSDIFETPADLLWKEVLRRMGKDYAVVADLPEDPSLN